MLPYLIISLGFLVTATNGVVFGCLFDSCEHICVNVAISSLGYECHCHFRHIVHPLDSRKCLPSCGRGYENSETSPYNCVDIDECSSGTSQCEQNCRNRHGSYECTCRSGYVVSLKDPTRCERQSATSCPTGFQPNPQNSSNCIDIDECANNSPCQQLCINSKGSFECGCRSGYQINEADNYRCDIINYCQEGYKPSLWYWNTCEVIHNCREGYKPNPLNASLCEDVDECIEINKCWHRCSNTVGGFICLCNGGFEVREVNSFECVDIDECKDNNPCEHNCDNTKGSYKCSCRDGFSVDPNNQNKCVGTDACSVGRRCEHICTVISTGRKCSCNPGFVVNDEDNTLCDKIEVCKAKADVLLIFDASSSIGAQHFDKQFVFAKRLTSNFNIGATAVRFGGLVYSRFTKVLFNLKDNNNIESVHKALTNVEYMDSSTYTHEALETVDKQQLFSSAKGGRDDAPDVIVLFTDGNPTYEDRAIEAAQKLKDSGVLIIGLGIGSGLDMAVLKKISSTKDDALEASSYDTLDYTEKRLTKLLCDLSKSG